ncbi:MAG: hypothetical protein PXX83_00515 [Candidatus Nitrosotalea sp.]|nr:hypothetical protein [Candidatus Nitrosotalea sp.]
MLGPILFLTNIIKETNDPVPGISESLDFATGIFAAILFAMSLIVYRRTNLKRMLFVSAAFGLYAFRAILPRMDIFLPDLDLSTSMEILLSIMGFIILSLFFVAIVKKK